MKKIFLVLGMTLLLVACSTKTPEYQLNKTKYVGDNSKVIAIVDGLKYPNGLAYDNIEIQSEKEPYGLSVNLSGEGEANLFDQAVVTFAMIDNLGELKYFNSNKEIGLYTREAVDLILNTNGTSLEELNKDGKKLQEYIDKANLAESK
ncbi:protein of unknown function [Peptoniphilus asaccharolyticus DSM 20463]|uniref:DUF4825 domain-containing protein n=1 Tax=Peptoniphilus asaccharolyticus DSM 20463 TaxID=573058 RepID=A0A1W1VE88_PEPAS|nr:DUF4825 domain-containing protein [Peptoniphilus asaccharolyticus]MBL7574565.1 DUF4825 domain-containing protein [Peptoniphilus asaccharolyticus]SMB91371.1 protein of unknown function [Peptoniphilus asaccharolyticus DSM 20463]